MTFKSDFAKYDSALRALATSLILAGSLAGCGDKPPSSNAMTYSDQDTGKVMPVPQFATREKCYGIALAQKNDCAAGKGTNCAGTAEKDYMPEHWQYIAMGECTAKGGSLIEPDDVYRSEK